MRVFRHYDMRLALRHRPIPFPYLKYKALVIITPLGYFPNRMLRNDGSFLYEIDAFGFEEEFERVFCWDGEC